MFKIGELVSYSATGVCEIVDIRSEKLTDREMQYYILNPMYQNSSTVYVPVENEVLVSRMKPIITADEAKKLISEISNTTYQWIENDSERITFFRETLRTGERSKILAVIKCLATRQDYLSTIQKNLRSLDAQLLKEAQNVLYGELSMVLNIPVSEVEILVKEKFKN
jgi:CarD family transcriptional regulator